MKPFAFLLLLHFGTFVSCICAIFLLPTQMYNDESMESAGHLDDTAVEDSPEYRDGTGTSDVPLLPSSCFYSPRNILMFSLAFNYYR